MGILYFFGLKLYHTGIFIASIFNKKAEKWVKGRKGLFNTISEKVKQGDRIIWFHAASLGEFEQGRPVIEAIREKHKEYKILITFFSPSGYEIRKNYQGADYIFYLPMDSKKNARRFIEIVKPEKAFFIKYEFWYYYIKALFDNNIPVYLISAIFRENQVFFKSYTWWFRQILHFFNHIFVQDEKSLQLLNGIQVYSCTVSGDTRFDRVLQIAEQAKSIEKAELFRDGKTTVVCGSTWEKDEDLLINYINTSKLPVKFIIAPHEIHEGHIQNIISKLKKTYVRFSNSDNSNFKENEVLIIDNIGMLSSLYRYGDFAYIGGGFGVGIHNILEAATFGLPVIFGPNYQKFKEARDLILQQGAFSVSSYNQLFEVFDKMMNVTNRTEAGTIARNYVISNCGATNTIMKSVFG